MKHIAFYTLFLAIITISSARQEPVKIGIAGLSHSHVIPLLRNLDRVDIQIAGIAESNTDLSGRYADTYHIDKNLLDESPDEMLEKTKPDGVITFTSIFEHLKVVEACAPRRIDVMVEKPLAVSNEHARIIAKLSHKHGIQVLTNYETTWYPLILMTWGESYQYRRENL